MGVVGHHFCCLCWIPMNGWERTLGDGRFSLIRNLSICRDHERWWLLFDCGGRNCLRSFVSQREASRVHSWVSVGYTTKCLTCLLKPSRYHRRLIERTCTCRPSWATSPTGWWLMESYLGIVALGPQHWVVHSECQWFGHLKLVSMRLWTAILPKCGHHFALCMVWKVHLFQPFRQVQRRFFICIAGTDALGHCGRGIHLKVIVRCLSVPISRFFIINA